MKLFLSPLSIGSRTPGNNCSGRPHTYSDVRSIWSGNEKKYIHRNPFTNERLEEIRGMTNDRTLERFDASNVAKHVCIFEFCFANLIKAYGSGGRYKGGIFAQNHRYDRAGTVTTKGTTAQWLAQWIMLSRAALLKYRSTDVRDITHTHIQPDTLL